MNNKKTFILGIIAIVALSGIVWYASVNKEEIAGQAASLLGSNNEQSGETESIGDLVLGSPDAPVVVTEYSSHTCGHCIDFHIETLPLIMDKYVKTGKVKIIFRPLSPLELELAVVCAQEQGSFQEINDYLFEHIQEIGSVDDILAIAGILGLNQSDFNECFDSQRYIEDIQKWFDQASAANLDGTPTFFINEQRISGNLPYSVFEQAIEQELNK
ncbi:MAG: thioredoxin domain-containing protein [bacterium]